MCIRDSAYAPDYIGKINEFSADISNASLTLGTKIVLPNSESQGKDSVDLIRDMAVEDHRASTDHKPRSIDGKIVAEADRMINPVITFTPHRAIRIKTETCSF